MLAGLIRAEVSSPDGRSLVIRYARPGALLGMASLFGEPYIMPGSLYAVVDSELLELRPDVVRRVAREEIAVANAILDELSDRVVGFVAEIPGSAFTTVHQRIARHLLGVASRDPMAGRSPGSPSSSWPMPSGSVREVVVRELRGMRETGTVRTGSRSITILDPDRVAADAGETAPVGLEPRFLTRHPARPSLSLDAPHVAARLGGHEMTEDGWRRGSKRVRATTRRGVPGDAAAPRRPAVAARGADGVLR